ncbi:MAG: phosphoadenosine phosphosulfate reductase family protein [Intrasporangium sp.]|uniref:phosphoadenosine phosphosulfate reductase family protein n=1 Tax=Intrasporangium sp. TaxID=1925024 RepID=UPI002647027B|nr:phosphoadenosine phosphosulfate reductase family protein [Intrasporangium sp.]MDN5797469.1 phosphoadenosine phosphosulfate reductase family protein [Intrasporangium sp.]
MSRNPGLDVRALQGLRSTQRDLPLLYRRIEDHLDRCEGYVAFSGGKDSLVTLHLVLQVEPDVPVAFFDSGLEFPETYAYIEDLAHQWRLNLDVIPAEHTTLEVLAATGAWDHHAQRNPAAPDLHRTLITTPAATAHERHGPGELWGVRAEESRGRAAAYANALRATPCDCSPTHCTTRRDQRSRHGGLIQRVDGTTAYGPVWDWKTPEIWGHVARHNIPVNPVYDKLRRLGAPEHFLRVSHMVDGTRLEEGRVTWLRRGWPALFEELAVVLPRLREYV